jgi:hypothetical protein
MVQMAQAAAIKGILATIPPWETDPITVGDIAYNADPSVGRYVLIDVWNTWLRQYAFNNNIPLADYHTALEASNSENYITALTIDGVHPSAQGYVVMTPLADEAITSAMKVPVAPSALEHSSVLKLEMCRYPTDCLVMTIPCPSVHQTALPLYGLEKHSL